MLSTLPKLADKAFIIGFFLPTLLFVMAGLALFSDFAVVEQLLRAALSKEIAGRLVILLLALWSLSILMMVFNHHLYQILEGYRWPVSAFAMLKTRERARYQASYDRYEELGEGWTAAKRATPPVAYPEPLQREYDKLRRDLVQNFPEDENSLLPTRFGNAIRAFETYSKQVYGADPIPLWLHLSSVIPKEFAAALDDARAAVNFLLNICYFAGIISLAAFVRVVVHGSIVTPPLLDLKTLLFAAVAVGAGCICRTSYNFSIESIHAWGDLVKAAFDCFLPALAERLGYALPKSAADQQNFWTDVSRRAIYHLPLAGEWPQAGAKAKCGTDKSASGHAHGKGDGDDKDDEDDTDDADDKSDVATSTRPAADSGNLPVTSKPSQPTTPT